jgi:hypothetical protein
LQNWKLYYDIFDDGDLDNIPGDRFDDDTKDPFRLHHGDKITQFRMDRILRPEGKFLSARSIIRGNREEIDQLVGAY